MMWYLNPALRIRIILRTLSRYPLSVLSVLVIVSTLIFQLPFWLHDKENHLYRHWDGPNYMYVAKTLYDIPEKHPLSAYTKSHYFAAHLPLFPLSIRLLTFPGLSYPHAMLLATFLYTWATTLVLFVLLRETRVVQSPIWSAFIALFIPARYLLNHNIGATEAPFLFFTLLSLRFYFKKQYLAAFMLGGFSGITRITGILIGLAYFFDLSFKRRWKPILLLPLVALPLLATFIFYYFQFGDFFAYFKVNLSNSNKLVRWPPFLIFKAYSYSGNLHSAELYLTIYAVYGVGVVLLWYKNITLFWYAAVHYLFSLLIFHEDLSRYFIPIAPFALVVAYDQILSKAPVKLVTLGLIALCYHYAWGATPQNNVVNWVYKKLEHSLTQ